MRTHNHIHLRHIMLYHFEKAIPLPRHFRDLNDLFGERTIDRKTVYEWFDRFKSGDTSLEDKPGRVRPSDFDDQTLLAAVEEDESLTTRILAEQFNVDHFIIVRRLKKLGKVWKLARWVPHELTDQNKISSRNGGSPTEMANNSTISTQTSTWPSWTASKLPSKLKDRGEEPHRLPPRQRPAPRGRKSGPINHGQRLGPPPSSSLFSHRGPHRLPC
uniref:Mos1 transposase HTH domain-containing protein n=1 Tax=Acrobeloides nanus TaxID=290746 RepID=A0A914C3I4_9BILA